METLEKLYEAIKEKKQYYYDSVNNEHYFLPIVGYDVLCLSDNGKATKDEKELIKNVKNNKWSVIRHFTKDFNIDDVHTYGNMITILLPLNPNKIFLHNNNDSKLMIYKEKITDADILSKLESYNMIQIN